MNDMTQATEDRATQIANLRKAAVQLLDDYSSVEWSERTDYSGRAMYGKTSPLAFVVNRGPASTVGQQLKDLGFHHDSMGRDVIYYLQS